MRRQSCLPERCLLAKLVAAAARSEYGVLSSVHHVVQRSVFTVYRGCCPACRISWGIWCGAAGSWQPSVAQRRPVIVGSNCLCRGSWHRQWVQIWSRLLLAPTGCGLGTADAVPMWVHTSQLQEWCCNLHMISRGEGGKKRALQSGQSRDRRSLMPPAPHLTVLHAGFETTSAIS